VTLNWLRTRVERCRQLMHRWGLTDNLACHCSETQQTIEHIIVDCPERRFQRNMKEITELTKEAVDWITNLDINL